MSESKTIIEKIINDIREKKEQIENEKLNNILFLDYDGVISIVSNSGGKRYISNVAIHYINELCLNNDFKIVVISSWKDHPGYQEMLYSYGLDKNVVILGKTENSKYGREKEIEHYLKDHSNISKFIIIDDCALDELAKYQIQTDYHVGFDAGKYEEAIRLIDSF